MQSRRRFLARAARAVLAAAVVPPSAAVATPASGAASRWLDRAQVLAADAVDGRVSSRRWRRRMLRHAATTTAHGIRRAIGFDDVAVVVRAADGPEPQARIARWAGAGTDGLACTILLSHVRARHAVVPHGHRNMVSMHVVLDGVVRVRQYDRLADDATALVVRPSADRLLRPGAASAISADRGNVHWFQGMTDAWLLIVAAYDAHDGENGAVRDYVDPLAGTPLGGGIVRVPRLSEHEAFARYLRW